jgi:hypothetical protein
MHAFALCNTNTYFEKLWTEIADAIINIKTVLLSSLRFNLNYK